MKHERVDQLIAAVRDGLPGIKFDMRSWGQDDCTVGCMAYHAAILALGKKGAKRANAGPGISPVSKIASEWLGLTTTQANRYFSAPNITVQCTDRDWAVRQLEALKLEDAT